MLTSRNWSTLHRSSSIDPMGEHKLGMASRPCSTMVHHGTQKLGFDPDAGAVWRYRILHADIRYSSYKFRRPSHPSTP
jgi:hypothetical protein